MTTEELAAFIFEHRRSCLATGEGGLVEPPELSAMDLLDLESWAMTQARRHKTKEAYLETQARALEKFREAITKLKQDHALAQARPGINQGLEIQAALQRQANAKKMLN